jgi:hypothetical protein
MKITAFDCAKKTGFANLLYDNIATGVKDFAVKGESQGMLFIRFTEWLHGLESMNPDIVVYESPHLRGKAATDICVGMTTRVKEYAARCGAELMAVDSNTLKAFLKKNVPIFDIVKMENECKSALTTSGYNKIKNKIPSLLYFEQETERKPIDDNESDAYALLRYAMNELSYNEEETLASLTEEEYNQEMRDEIE